MTIALLQQNFHCNVYFSARKKKTPKLAELEKEVFDVLLDNLMKI